MNFAEQPPSKQWAVLKFRGQKIAEVWFKPAGKPFGLTFRIPQASFQIPGLGQQLTAEILLKSVALEPAAVESWRHGEADQTGLDGTNPELRHPLPPPPPDAPYLELHVRLKPPADPVAPAEDGGPEIPAARWLDFEGRWRSILGLEASLDALRNSMEGLRSELENGLRKPLTTEEKLHALRADIAQWTKAKSRVHHALPKMREFIHRAVWMMGAPERKKLDEIYKHHVRPRVPFPQLEKLLDQLENMQKDRQVLSTHGTSVFNECKAIAGEIQGALRTLQGNAATRAARKKGASEVKGKR